MLEKIGDAAERLATNVSESRRGFLRRVGQVALGVAGAMGGLVLASGKASAASGSEVCVYQCPDGTTCRKFVARFHCERCLPTVSCGGQTCRFLKCVDPDW